MKELNRLLSSFGFKKNKNQTKNTGENNFFLINNNVLIKLTIWKYPVEYGLSLCAKSLYQNINECFYQKNSGIGLNDYIYPQTFKSLEELKKIILKEVNKIKEINSSTKLYQMVNYVYEKNQERFFQNKNRYNLASSEVLLSINLDLQVYEKAKKTLENYIDWNNIAIKTLENGNINFLNEELQFIYYNIGKEYIVNKLHKENDYYNSILELIKYKKYDDIRSLLNKIKKENETKYLYILE